MKAVVYDRYGPPDVLRLEERPKPTPGANEVLVKVHASSINAADWRYLTASPALIRFMGGNPLKPKFPVLGCDIAGVVEATGRDANQFKPGDEVYGDLADHGMGAYAEYACAPETALAPKPATLSFAEAAAIPLAAGTALQAARDTGNLQSGQHVLIHGAGGGVGTYAVQIAVAVGARVTAVCGSRNVDTIRSLGAHDVLDYTRDDFSQSGDKYDLILAVNGYRWIMDYARALTPKGRYVMVGGGLKQIFQAMLLGPWLSKKGGRQIGNVTAKASQPVLMALKDLAESGKLKPVIDAEYPLAETAVAFSHVLEGHPRGKVVINVA